MSSRVKKIDEMEAIYRGAFKRARAELGVESFGMQIIDMPPNFENYPEHDHAHDNQEEVFLAMRGGGEIEIDGERFPLDADHIARVGPETKRKLWPGPDGIRCLDPRRGARRGLRGPGHQQAGRARPDGGEQRLEAGGSASTGTPWRSAATRGSFRERSAEARRREPARVAATSCSWRQPSQSPFGPWATPGSPETSSRRVVVSAATSSCRAHDGRPLHRHGKGSALAEYPGDVRNHSSVRPAGAVSQTDPGRLVARVPHLVRPAATDVELGTGREIELLAVDDRAHRSLEHLEVLVLGGMEVRRGRGSGGR